MVSIKDVANKAGVAISTVSKVLNNYPNVSEATKAKVNQAVAELGFVPNPVAAALSSKQSGRAALLVNLSSQTQAIDEIDMRYICGAIEKASECHLELLTVFFSMIEDMELEDLIRYFKSQSISGIIIFGMSKDDVILHQLIDAQEFKIVVVDSPITNASTSSVWVDQKKAQYEVAKKTLLENQRNKKKFLYIEGKENGYITAPRTEGVKEVAKELGVSVTIKNGKFSEKKAREITFEYAESHDAVVCASDLMAIGAMKVLQEMDIFRPVCGFDGITLMGYAGMQMNTVKQDFAMIAQMAVEEMLNLMGGAEGQNIIAPHSLVQLEYLNIIK